MSLEPNRDVIPPDAHVTRLDSSGKIRSVEPVERRKHRVYRGNAYLQSSSKEWLNVGWARITLRRDGANPVFEGAFRVHGDHHHIHTASNYRRVKHAEDPNPVPPNDAAGASGEYMVVWRDSDIIEYWQPHNELRKRGEFGRVSCGSDDLSFNANFKRDEDVLGGASAKSLFGRQSDEVPGNNGAGINLVDYIGSTSGCPDTRKVALLGVAADCNYRAEFDSDEDAQDNIVQQINAASAVYESAFNISLGLQNLTLLSEDCPASAPDAAPWNVGCSNDVTITDRLSLFSEWRGRSEDSNAFWTLLTTCQTESAVGLAWLGQVCTQGSRQNSGDDSGEVISSANVVVRDPDGVAGHCARDRPHVRRRPRLHVQHLPLGRRRVAAVLPPQLRHVRCRRAVHHEPLNGPRHRLLLTLQHRQHLRVRQPDGGPVSRRQPRRRSPLPERSAATASSRRARTATAGARRGAGPTRAATPTRASSNPCLSATRPTRTAAPTAASSRARAAAAPARASATRRRSAPATRPCAPRTNTRTTGRTAAMTARGSTCASGQCTSRDQQCRSMVGATRAT